MTEFLSESSIELHREYLRQTRLKYSILEKSIKGLKEAKIADITRQNLGRKDKQDSLYLLGEVLGHELFFDSFGEVTYPPCPPAEARFGSSAALLNEIYKCASALRYGYVGVCISRRDIRVEGAELGYQLYEYGEPILVLDVCEHAYFADYAFDKEKYLLRAIPYLALGKISDFLENGCK